MRTAILSTIVAASLFCSMTALAVERKAPEIQTKRGIIVAVAAPESTWRDPVENPAPVAPPPAVKDAPAAPSEAPKVTNGGVAFGFGTGLGVLTGKAAEGAKMGAVLANVDLHLAVYVTPRVALASGVVLGAGVMTEGCSDCKAAHVGVPLVFQYAFTDRTHGGYFEGGFKLFPTYIASSEGGGSATVSGPADLKIGLGYRGAKKQGSITGLEIYGGLEAGEFTSVDDVKIGSSARALHVALNLGAGWHF